MGLGRCTSGSDRVRRVCDGSGNLGQLVYRMNSKNVLERCDSGAITGVSQHDCSSRAELIDALRESRPPLTWQERFAEIERSLSDRGKPMYEAREVR